MFKAPLLFTVSKHIRGRFQRRTAASAGLWLHFEGNLKRKVGEVIWVPYNSVFLSRAIGLFFFRLQPGCLS